MRLMRKVLLPCTWLQVNGHSDVIAALLDAGADINQQKKDVDGLRPSSHGNVEWAHTAAVLTLL
jgi:hypothetical protein